MPTTDAIKSLSDLSDDRDDPSRGSPYPFICDDGALGRGSGIVCIAT